ncbi:hypothetical protein LPJ53_000216 [Coemansia erecta]|uniref:Uncharacterized protein n=1 Tax=Coemansia erecta TaxID=147472 RepID=A0A9W8CVB2_9FUNG|nr:hypothetical protein LPJ53_000216 [Coemansia erecta]
MRHPFICTGSTVEVWLRFDGILLFGSWATEWAAMTLGHGSPGFSIQTLTIVIVESPVSAITPNEDMRARMLADVCSVALKPQAIGFMSQSCASKDTIAPGCDVGKKFGCIYSHMSRAQNPPALTSIETGTIDSDYMLWLVANSAGTLKCLRIRSTRPSTLQQLLCDTVDDIVFDSLKDILLILDMNDSLLQPFNITRQYFPSLECLDVVIPPQDIKQNRESSLSIFEHSFLTDLFFYAPGPIRMLNYPLTWDSVEVLTPDILCNIRHVALYEVSLEGEHLLDQDDL